MSVAIPPIQTDVDLEVAGSFGPVGPITIVGIPDSFHLSVDKLPKITLDIERIPKITLALDPVEVSLRLKELPSIRAHLPADFNVGFALLGFEIFSVRLCGEAQMITEPYRPNPCEVCYPPGPTRDNAIEAEVLKATPKPTPAKKDTP